ncbi:MaoC/PaaZ C-terminal domain-containing protein [Streptomyces sp. NPDC090127]|uniref:MaoC family dehydratase n=1 Tax=Streptomyces sp. NPDC090127 TaxID=3365953 RepID=UPI00380C7805
MGTLDGMTDLLALAGAVTRAPFTRARPRGPLPERRITRGPLAVDRRHLASYARICGYAPTLDGTPEPGLPLTYPHVLGFPAAMRLMSRRDFPLPLLGLVHTWISITRHAPLTAADRPEITVYAGELTPHRRGTEVTVVTEARLAGALVWESSSGYLARHADAKRPPAGHTHPRPTSACAPEPHPTEAAGGGPTDPTPEARGGGPTDPTPEARGAGPTDPTPEARGAGPTDPTPRPTLHPDPLPPTADWHLPADLGRRYAAASGDRNPIHLHPLTARAFGFPRTVAHGMWTLARCLAEQQAGARHDFVEAEFKSPVLLPGTVSYATDGAGRFELRTAGRLHLSGVTGETSARSS